MARRPVLWFLGFAACAPSTPGATGSSASVDTAVAALSSTPDTGEGATSSSATLRAWSLNLRCLDQRDTPFATVQERLAHVAAEAVAADVQVLALQEVCRTDTVDALAELEAAVEAASGEGWGSAWSFAHVAWEGTPDEAEEGVALLVRGVESLEAREQGYVAAGSLRRVGLGVALPDGPWLWSLHLDHADEAARLDQARQSAAAALSWADGPDVVVLGDLNARAGTAAHDAFLAMGFVDAGEALAGNRIDHALVHRGAAWGAAGAREVLTDPPVSDHPGIELDLVAQAPAEVPVTRLDVRADVGFGSWVSVRGDVAPLSWDAGWWAVPVAADHWRLVLTEVEGGFAFKALVDDVSWQTGDDVQGTGGEAVEVWPSF